MGTYVIVGGTSGIGLSLVKSLANAGNNVHVYSRNPGEIDSLPNVQFQRIDLAEDNVQFANLPEQITGLAYMPGSINLLPFNRIKTSQFLDDYRINFMGAVHAIQACLAGLKSAGNASVVLFSTVAVGTGMPFHASIASAKGAVEGLTRSLAAEYASVGIRFNCIAPSLTDTPLAQRLLNTDDKKEASKKRHPLGRYGTADELAEAASFLIQPSTSWITGQILHIDGGMSALRTL